MFANGVILDLFNKSSLDMQDVMGNVLPLPALVPYHEFSGCAIVYQMYMSHDELLSTLQDFTNRTAHEMGRELWTWFVQWRVDGSVTFAQRAAAKRPRIRSEDQDLGDTAASPGKAPAGPRPRGPSLPAGFYEIEDVLRLLIDIVQVESRLVPNFVELLYKMVDWFEGDGMALCAALRMEIPSLWLFEDHPLMLDHAYAGTTADPDGDHRMDNGESGLGEAQRKGKGKVREKPDVAAMEALLEASERLQYREVRFGVQPPIDPKDEPIPPLINVPRDIDKRRRYYAACWKCRRIALDLLEQAGVNAQKAASYRRLQIPHPRNTPYDERQSGLIYYYRDAPFASTQFNTNRRLSCEHKKQNEIAVSDRLMREVHMAAVSGHTNHMFPPSTGLHFRNEDLVSHIMHQMRNLSRSGDPPLNGDLPDVLRGKLRSLRLSQLGVSNDVESESVNLDSALPYSDPASRESDAEMTDHRRPQAQEAMPSQSQSQMQTNMAPGLAVPAETVPSTSSINQPMLGSPPPVPRAQTDDANGATQSTRPTLQVWRLHDPMPSHLIMPSPSDHSEDSANGSTMLAPLLSRSSTRAAPPPMLQLNEAGSASTIGQADGARPAVMTPLAGLTSNLSLASPFEARSDDAPIVIYVPRVIRTQIMSPLSDLLDTEHMTDCLILGHTRPGLGVFQLSKAVFMPVGVYQNVIDCVRRGTFEVLESYAAPINHPYSASVYNYPGAATEPDRARVPHMAIHSKVAQIYSLMANSLDRERELTKRWRVTKGAMTGRQRGSIWEGWAAYIDREISMRRDERRGAMVLQSVDGPWRNVEGRPLPEEERIRRLTEQILEEEGW